MLEEHPRGMVALNKAEGHDGRREIRYQRPAEEAPAVAMVLDQDLAVRYASRAVGRVASDPTVVVANPLSVYLHPEDGVWVRDALATPDRGTVHRLSVESEEPARMLEVPLGEFDEEDIVRLEDAYGRAGSVPGAQDRYGREAERA
ncbi:hypothetical protein GBA63_18235 [Rubrobacter tropicus]|uniref:Uncharacterized protein n=1 Tax=Rubrobacter tropicus TaxID=2653851 RepID=A0A6G8QD50_9ACTN|nr:hypothetical protein [Rubrobacter tropicus]QIN84362.1 hypothetical protein GBA63_18235 [Rubrobacter tropicus]